MAAIGCCAFFIGWKIGGAVALKIKDFKINHIEL
jgi:hypothetical protein